jgi:hypothetical protein
MDDGIAPLDLTQSLFRATDTFVPNIPDTMAGKTLIIFLELCMPWLWVVHAGDMEVLSVAYVITSISRLSYSAVHSKADHMFN